jgi:hypothetical protein
VCSPIDRPERSSHARLWRTEIPSAGQDEATKRPEGARRARPKEQATCEL